MQCDDLNYQKSTNRNSPQTRVLMLKLWKGIKTTKSLQNPLFVSIDMNEVVEFS